MKRRHSLLVLSALAILSVSASVRADFTQAPIAEETYHHRLVMPDGSTLHYQANKVEGHYVAESDILLGPTSNSENGVDHRSSGISIRSNRWHDGIIPYRLSDEITSQNLRSRVESAIAHWNEKSSIRLIERTAENEDIYKDYLEFTDSNSCASYVGRIGGRQEIWVSDTCTTGSMIHEIGHAIGLLHEHTRNDRDQYIVVNYDDITPGKEHNFAIPGVNATDLGVYDYSSIMHYGAYFFSRAGNPTISPIEDITGLQMGQRIALSQGDIDGVNRIYATDLSLTLEVPNSIAANNQFTLSAIVSNLGDIGANELLIVVPISPENQLIDIEGVGWECEQQVDKILCGLATLIEFDQSQINLTISSGSEPPQSITANLSSRTWDPDQSNNGLVLSQEEAAESHDEFFEEPMTSAAVANAANAESGMGAGTFSLVYVVLLGLLVFSRKTS